MRPLEVIIIPPPPICFCFLIFSFVVSCFIFFFFSLVCKMCVLLIHHVSRSCLSSSQHQERKDVLIVEVHRTAPVVRALTSTRSFITGVVEHFVSLSSGVSPLLPLAPIIHG